MSCITLLSDFGLYDASVAIAKGVLMQHSDLPIIDISHEIKPYHTTQAAYLLSSSWKNFPGGTVHVLLFDMFAGKPPALLLCEYEQQYFLSADNGLLTMAVGNIPAHLVTELNNENIFVQWLSEAGKIINKLHDRGIDALNLPVHELRKTNPLASPAIEAGHIACEVMHIDHFGNAVLNINKQQFEEQRKGRNFRLSFMTVEEITELSANYTDVREGSKLCRFNSNGYLEICINRGKAADLFGLRLGSRHNNIKIYFE
ncbi:MAG: hypothetical protein K0Q79_2879 [Flavipsychrobacter sp.]|jgi:S-adenosylmethionine hydrolase|nr:hypothetical protein [Flavipsychrobacter sp.]